MKRDVAADKSGEKLVHNRGGAISTQGRRLIKPYRARGLIHNAERRVISTLLSHTEKNIWKITRIDWSHALGTTKIARAAMAADKESGRRTKLKRGERSFICCGCIINSRFG